MLLVQPTPGTKWHQFPWMSLHSLGSTAAPVDVSGPVTTRPSPCCTKLCALGFSPGAAAGAGPPMVVGAVAGCRGRSRVCR